MNIPHRISIGNINRNLLFIFFFSFLSISYSQSDTSRIISFIGVGDIMLGTDYPTDKLPPDDGKYLMSGVSDILSAADITFGNYEGVLLNGGEARKECKDTSICYLFRTPGRFTENLKSAGFDLISLANNHARDFGDDGRDSAQIYLDSAGIKYSGKTGSIALTNVDSVKIGFAAFAPNEGCNSLLNIKSAERLIKRLSGISDIVIVSMHGGAEGDTAIHVPNEMEFAYGEKRGSLIEFAHSAIDAGADLVIGHGPHVPRAIELYGGRLIAYSLGNFCTYKGFRISGIRGYAPILQVDLNEKGKFVAGKIISARQFRSRGTALDPERNAYKLIKKLSQQDFPGSDILFRNDGRIFSSNLE